MKTWKDPCPEHRLPTGHSDIGSRLNGAAPKQLRQDPARKKKQLASLSRGVGGGRTSEWGRAEISASPKGDQKERAAVAQVCEVLGRVRDTKFCDTAMFFEVQALWLQGGRYRPY